MHEMLAKLNFKWSSSDSGDGGAPVSGLDMEGGGGMRGTSGASLHSSPDMTMRQRSSSSGHNLVASGTPVALKGKVGSTAAYSEGAAMSVDSASLPRPGQKGVGSAHGEVLHRRAGASAKSD